MISNKLDLARQISEELELLRDTVQQMNIKGNVKSSLIGKLDSAILKTNQAVGFIESGNDADAKLTIKPSIWKVQAFLNHVKKQHGKGIPSQDADALITNASNIVGDLTILQNLLRK